jgi:dTDP-4-amino-4,6-dideoxygalactose transaminase
MTDLAAAIGRFQLRRLDEMNRRRRDHAAAYDKAFAGLGPGLVTPSVQPNAVHSYHQYTIRVAPRDPSGRHGGRERDALCERLTQSGVESKVFYPVPVHRLASFDMEMELPETQRACEEVLSIPVGPHLSDRSVDTVIDAVLAAVSE